MLQSRQAWSGAQYGFHRIRSVTKLKNLKTSFDMMMFVTMAMPSWASIAFIVLLVLLLFGAKKIPEMMRGMGRGVKEFKDAINKDYSAEDTPSGGDQKKIEEK